MNDLNSAETYRLSFWFNIPPDLCQSKFEDDVDMYCNPGIKYQKALQNKWIVILNNQKRIVSKNYDGEGHIVKETAVEWMPFPQTQTLLQYEIQETIIEREDSIAMEIYGVTE